MVKEVFFGWWDLCLFIILKYFILNNKIFLFFVVMGSLRNFIVDGVILILVIRG